eukprot:CAMPEP_0179190334 /NCGR_PEP_ID=MMETSP0796-20121207/94504_1 /TAXON_ID=73915 /ORGANISM="Pyrodinium bahamense, Strain pbaha01" /LENGTH=113 /DNA_ID=CAMNT_0020894497 /DNA_START=28 /DNA_END=369 /DNA_ORIENTATION=-
MAGCGPPMIRRASLKPEEDNVHDAEAHAKLVQNEVELQYKQNHLRTRLEMWLMDKIPALYGVKDSEDLREGLREDEQALKVEDLLQTTGDPAATRSVLEEILEQVDAIRRVEG